VVAVFDAFGGPLDRLEETGVKVVRPAGRPFAALALDERDDVSALPFRARIEQF
jgi:hypothetical protein